MNNEINNKGKLGGFPTHAVFPFNRFSFHLEKGQKSRVSEIGCPGHASQLRTSTYHTSVVHRAYTPNDLLLLFICW
jgi:hypothetical protein